MKVDDVLMVVIGLLILIIFYKIYKGSLIEGAEDIKPNDWDTGKKGCENYYSRTCAVSPNKYCIANTGGVCNSVIRRECKGKEGTWCKKPYCGFKEIPDINQGNFIDMVGKYPELIKCFDVGTVKTMSHTITGHSVFQKNFNQDISYWDVSSVENMGYMFSGCKIFNKDISYWNVSSVDNMKYMFSGCKIFNQDISYWNVSSVKNMTGMFLDCTSFNRDISYWKVSSVENMSFMFSSCTAFNGDIKGWDVSLVTNMSGMFYLCKNFNVDLSSWVVSSVTNMYSMFFNCTSFNKDIKGWDVSSVAYMGGMFEECTSFDQDLSSWNVSSVTDMSDIFKGCENTTNIIKSVKSWIDKKNKIPALSKMTEEQIYKYLGIIVDQKIICGNLNTKNDELKKQQDELKKQQDDLNQKITDKCPTPPLILKSAIIIK